MDFHSVLSANNTTSLEVEVPDKWGQGRATFGGLVAALMYQKVEPLIEDGRNVRSILLSFVGPVSPGKMDVITKVLRAGKGATQVQATALQNDQVCAVMLASFGADRDSVIDVPFKSAPATRAPDMGDVMPYIAGMTPDFTQYFDYRFTEGKMPFMGSDQPKSAGWIRLKEPCSSNICVPEILALLDAWPPATFTMLKRPASGSSLTWNINFIHQSKEAKGNDWWQYQADIQHSKHGYGHVDAAMWDHNGDIAVLSRQTISVFA